MNGGAVVKRKGFGEKTTPSGGEENSFHGSVKLYKLERTPSMKPKSLNMLTI
jgi:hypothetical protein